MMDPNSVLVFIAVLVFLGLVFTLAIFWVKSAYDALRRDQAMRETELYDKRPRR